MATIIHLKDLMANTTFEPPCNIFYGICNQTVANPIMVMGLTRSDSDMRNQRHYHINCDAAQYKIKGHDHLVVGPDHERQVLDYCTGDFSFIPKGEIHGATGIGESNELIFCYANVGSKDEAGTVFIEPPWDQTAEAVPVPVSHQGGKTRARIIKEPQEDKVYAAPLITGFGINSETVENPDMVLGTSIMPPGGWNRRHYHTNADVAMYKIKGHDRMSIGPDHEMQEMDFQEGDFIYIPRGEIHGAINLDNKEGFLVFCYVGAGGSLEEIKKGKIYVVPEPPQ
ncbi:cupin domain-containing protein [Chloroflexota bacterium]